MVIAETMLFYGKSKKMSIILCFYIIYFRTNVINDVKIVHWRKLRQHLFIQVHHEKVIIRSQIDKYSKELNKTIS